jgi:hypothetical protein
MVKKPCWKIVTVYDSPSIGNKSLSDSLTPNLIKSGFLAAGVWLLITDIFTDEDFSPSCMTDHSLQNNKNLENLGLRCSHTSDWNLDVSSQSSTSDLNRGHSSSESNLQHVSPVEMQPFPKSTSA